MNILSMLLVIAIAATTGLGGASLPAGDRVSSTPPAVTAMPATDTTAPAIQYEGPGFDTPDAAVTCYLEGLKNLDFEQMLSAFAWETQVSHYNFNAYYNRIKAYLPTTKPRMPSVNEFMMSANLHELRSAQIDSIYSALEVYILGNDHPQCKAIVLKEQSEIDAFLQKFANGRLEKLTEMSNIRFVTPDSITNSKFSEKKNQENFAKQIAVYGAKNVVNIPALADIGDETLFCCPTVALYGDRWYLVSVSSFTTMMLGISSNCQAFICGRGSLKDIIR